MSSFKEYVIDRMVDEKIPIAVDDGTGKNKIRSVDDDDRKNDRQDHYYRLRSIHSSIMEFCYIKQCMYYNKKVLSQLRGGGGGWSSAQFSTLSQDRSDLGSPASCNYAKVLIDKKVSKISQYNFRLNIIPSSYSISNIYIDDVINYFNDWCYNNNIDNFIQEATLMNFVMGRSFSWINPWTDKLELLNTGEVSYYNSEYQEKKIKHILVVKNNFPKSALDFFDVLPDQENYIEGLLKSSTEDHVRLSLYIDAADKRVKTVWVNDIKVSSVDYDDDEIYISCMTNDVETKRGIGTSLLDSLFLLQLDLNNIYTKRSNLRKVYKGPVPVFRSDENFKISTMSTTSAEALNIVSDKSAIDYVTTLQPTAFDPNLTAEGDSIKKDMELLASTSQVSIDLEQYRNAGQILALRQIQDEEFSPHIIILTRFLIDVAYMYVKYFAKKFPSEKVTTYLSWSDLKDMFDRNTFNFEPAHNNMFSENNGDRSENDKKALEAAARRIIRKWIISDGNVTDEEIILRGCLEVVERYAILILYNSDEIYAGLLTKLLYRLFLIEYKLGNI